MEDSQITTVIIIGTLFTSVVMLLAGILVLFVQRKRIMARQDLHDATLKHEREKYQTEILVQERTMRDFGKTLHDDFGPVLTSLKIYLEVISREFNGNTPNPQVQKSISEMKSVIEETVTKMRNASKLLYPVNLERYGLVEAVSSLARNTAEQLSIPVEFQHNVPDDLDLGKVREIVLFRLIQELLHNAMKYAEASLIEIDLSALNGELCLKFRDNGIGIRTLPETEGIGLAMARSRIESLNGTFELLNADKGTSFEVKIPLVKAHD